jgi:hypothetical protein
MIHNFKEPIKEIIKKKPVKKLNTFWDKFEKIINIILN